MSRLGEGLSLIRDRTVVLPLVGPFSIDLTESACVPLTLQGHCSHQSSEADAMAYLIERGPAVFDIGASIGYASQRIARLVAPAGTVVAVGPTSRALRLLVKPRSIWTKLYRQWQRLPGG